MKIIINGLIMVLNDYTLTFKLCLEIRLPLILIKLSTIVLALIQMNRFPTSDRNPIL